MIPMSITHLHASASGSEIADRLRRDGACVVADLADDATLDWFFAEMQPHIDATPSGPDAFSGHHHLTETFHDPSGDHDSCGWFFFIFRPCCFFN